MEYWIKNCPLTEIKLIHVSEMPEDYIKNKMHVDFYTYTHLDEEWVIRKSIHTNN